MEKKMVFCVRETQPFPEDQFFTEENGDVVHKIGVYANWHYALTGEPRFPQLSTYSNVMDSVETMVGKMRRG